MQITRFDMALDRGQNYNQWIRQLFQFVYLKSIELLKFMTSQFDENMNSWASGQIQPTVQIHQTTEFIEQPNSSNNRFHRTAEFIEQPNSSNSPINRTVEFIEQSN